MPLCLLSQPLHGTNNSSRLSGLVLGVPCRHLPGTVPGTDWLRDTAQRLLLFFCVCVSLGSAGLRGAGLVDPGNPVLTGGPCGHYCLSDAVHAREVTSPPLSAEKGIEAWRGQAAYLANEEAGPRPDDGVGSSACAPTNPPDGDSMLLLQDSLCAGRAGRQGSPRRAPLLTDWWVPPGALGGRCPGTPGSSECGWLTAVQFLPGDTSEARAPVGQEEGVHPSSRAGFPEATPLLSCRLRVRPEGTDRFWGQLHPGAVDSCHSPSQDGQDEGLWEGLEGRRAQEGGEGQCPLVTEAKGLWPVVRFCSATSWPPDP